MDRFRRFAQMLRRRSRIPPPPSPPRADPGLPPTPRERHQRLRELLRWLIPWGRRRNTDDTQLTRPSYRSGASTAGATAGSHPEAADQGAAEGANERLRVGVPATRASTSAGGNGDGASGGRTPNSLAAQSPGVSLVPSNPTSGAASPGPGESSGSPSDTDDSDILAGAPEGLILRDENVDDAPWDPLAGSYQPTQLQMMLERDMHDAGSVQDQQDAATAAVAGGHAPAAAWTAAAAASREGSPSWQPATGAEAVTRGPSNRAAAAYNNNNNDDDDSPREDSDARDPPSLSTQPTSLGVHAEEGPGGAGDGAAAVAAAVAANTGIPVPPGGRFDLLGIIRLRVRTVTRGEAEEEEEEEEEEQQEREQPEEPEAEEEERPGEQDG
jgi:hypothetical protein